MIQQSIEVARAGIAIAEQRPNPTLNYAVPIGPAERKQRLVFNVPLETGGRRKARLEVAQDGIVEAELNRSQARLLLANQTRNAFIELAISEAGVRQAEVELEFYQGLLKAASARFQAGDIAESDVIRSQFEKDQAARFVYPAENRRGVAVLTLNRLLGQPLATAVVPVDDGQVFPDLLALDGLAGELPTLEKLQELAREKRPDLALAAQKVATARDRVKLARANQSPEVSLQATLLHDPIYPAFTYQAGVQVELPWGSDRGGEVQQARAQETEMLLQSQAALAAADLSVSLAWTNLQNAREQLKHDLVSLAPQAEQVLELAQKSFELGLGNLTEVLLAGQSVQRQRQAYLADVAQFHRALGELELAINTPLTGEKP